MSRQPLTAYLLDHRVTSLESATPVLRNPAAERLIDNATLRLFVGQSPPRPPQWASYVGTFASGNIEIRTSSASAMLLVPTNPTAEASRVMAFVFGVGGQQFLDRSWIEHGFGLRCALNACFPRGTPTGSMGNLRSIDSKAFNEVALDTRQLASRNVDFDVFGMNIRTDLLRAVEGVPLNEPLWGSRVRGRDSFSFSSLPDKEPVAIARELLALWERTDYQQHFAWIDNIQPVRDQTLISDLETKVAEAVKRKRLDLVGPEGLDLGRTRYYWLSGDRRGNQRHVLEITEYSDRLRAESDFTITRIKRDRIRSFDDDGTVVDDKTVFECLAGDLIHDRKTYVIADGKFYSINRNFHQTLDADVAAIPRYGHALPSANFDEHEDAYNKRAATHADLLLLDKELIRPGARTTSVEACDLLSRAGALIHIKRHARSSLLSHLFSQGAVAGELLMTDQTFREALQQRAQEIEDRRQRLEHQYAPGIANSIPTTQLPTRNTHEIVFAIIHRWNGRQLAESLPFFSKLNLRQRNDDLIRLGVRVSVAQIDST